MTLELTLLPFDLQGTIYRSVMPYGSYDPNGEVLTAYRSVHISMVVALAEAEEIIRLAGRDLLLLYQQQGWQVLHFPIRDFDIPEPESLKHSVQNALNAASIGEQVAIHCSAGVGRTGMFAACMAKHHFATTGEQAIAWVRRFIPQAVETEKQRKIVLDF